MRVSMEPAALLRMVAVVVMAIWVCLSIYQQFIEVDPLQYGITAPDLQAQMANCGGNYEQRADCKEKILDAGERSTFVTVWMKKVAIILGPPLVLWLLVGYAARERKAPPPARRRPSKAAPRRPTR